MWLQVRRRNTLLGPEGTGNPFLRGLSPRTTVVVLVTATAGEE